MYLNRLRRSLKSYERLPRRARVTFLSRQESNQRNAHPVARRPSAGSLRSSLKPGAAQLARIKKPIRAQTVLAHCSGLSCGARRTPTGELQRQQQHPRGHFVPYSTLLTQILKRDECLLASYTLTGGAPLTARSFKMVVTTARTLSSARQPRMRPVSACLSKGK